MGSEQAGDHSVHGQRPNPLTGGYMAGLQPIIDEVPRLSAADKAILEREVLAQEGFSAEGFDLFLGTAVIPVTLVVLQLDKVCPGLGIETGSLLARALFLAALGGALADERPILSVRLLEPWNKMIAAR